MRKLICIFSLLATSTFALADAADELNQILDENVPKVSASIDKASRATGIQDLTDSQNLTAQALETLKTQVFTWLAKRSNQEPAPRTIAAMNYWEVFLAEVRGAQDKLEYLFDSSDPALSAANERIRHALNSAFFL
jgi:hypothetical protein